jgi:SAM-dependent methyltransferase
VNRDEISAIAHSRHPIKAPVEDSVVLTLLEHGLLRGATRVLDLGCGSGEWLLRALSGRPQLRAEGVDISAAGLELAHNRAGDLGVADRLRLHHCEAAEFESPDPFDLVISVGATHAFGGLTATLAAARGYLADGGCVLIGECYWERPPNPEAVELFGELDDLATAVDRIGADGWTPIYGHISTREELDAYEWACWGSLAGWALDNPEHPDHEQALDTADTQRDQWLKIYRDCFGFVCLVLRPTG